MACLIDYGWHEWLCKTNFSFLVGASHPFEIMQQASLQGYQSICISDYDGVYGLARTYLAGKSLSSSVKLHYASEIHLIEDHEQPVLLQQTLVLLAQSHRGYRNICCILNHAHRESKTTAKVSLSELESFDLKDIVAIQPMRGAVRLLSHSQVASHYSKIKQLFGSSFFLALSSHHQPAENVWIPKTLSLAKQLDVAILPAQDAFFHTAENKALSDLLHAIRVNQTLSKSSSHFFPNGERHLHSLKWIDKTFSRFPDYSIYLKNSHLLAESCQFQFDELKYKYPQEFLPKGVSSQGYLEQIVWQNVCRRYPRGVATQLKSNLQKELNLIKDLGFADYFLTVWDIVRWAREQDILCQGRGSAANSAVCYILEITSVDPNQFDLLFERFISKERGDPPDIDIDFEHERREEVVQYIYQRYGRQRAAMVANVITFRLKGALRATGKALGIPEPILGTVSKKIRSKYFRGKSTREILAHLKHEMEQEEELSNLLPPASIWPLWSHMADSLKGFPRHLGIHSGGFIIAETHLSELVAQEPATMPGRTVIQWCKEDIEGLEFFKIDVLSLGMLTALRKAFDLVRDNYNKDLSLYQVPHDEKTYQMIQRADTVGTFQIESRAQMSMLPRLKPKNFYDLVIEIAIIRPGPIQGGVVHPFLRRRDGREKIEYPHPSLEPILKNTSGIVIFQEQAMRIAIEVGDFTAGEANELRKNIGAWNISGFEKKLGPWLEKLSRGLEKNGITGPFKQQIMGQLKGFSDYGFPESHAISFALLAYVSCYLKCHYPAAFFTAVLNSQPMGFYSPHSLLQSAQHDGVKVLGLSVNRSRWEHQLEKIADGSCAIRLGFCLVRSLSQTAVDKLVEERDKNGSYTDFENLLERSQLFRNDLTALAATDVFSEFKIPRSEALWASEALPLRPLVESVEKEIQWPEDNILQKIQKDFHSYRTSLWEHPVLVIKREFWHYEIPVKRLKTSAQLASAPGRQTVYAFGMIMIKQAPGSAKGMVFVSIEDEEGVINLVFTPQVYQRFYRSVEGDSFLCVSGLLQKAGVGHSILVKSVFNTQRKVTHLRKPRKRLPQEKELQRPRSYY